MSGNQLKDYIPPDPHWDGTDGPEIFTEDDLMAKDCADKMGLILAPVVQDSCGSSQPDSSNPREVPCPVCGSAAARYSTSSLYTVYKCPGEHVIRKYPHSEAVIAYTGSETHA